MRYLYLLFFISLFSISTTAQNLSLTELTNLQKNMNFDKVEMYLNKKNWEITNIQTDNITFGYDVDFATKNSTYFLKITQNENGNTLLI